ncbi:4-(cytidine 5'-diphospho)-2-C-methyl-D-erythritol kinase [Alsobacter sp. SYSU M60028]|uniref:4-diphosphocytidyl-2-C-methyl-D-erythritol kinase n=1 Tax=Alsobacter ponti TaxID=2962936 RepID=A0ABT1LCP2_9HYPH|nr:4-(cytidine 5'-diphospho)-2-C-methyl-D-erythritol kinase [Alsobacter ponti]MCP8939269.1 4-(cytidine 5'-diphospho)-2-C-methyl-D-erythritol kinase [Alsobacter ponti]
MAAEPAARAGLDPSRAPAKVNLTLRVLGRRADGYHDLDSLVAFAGAGDRLSFAPGPDWAIRVEGPSAADTGDPADNLVLKAARALEARCPGLPRGSFRLTKRLPVAAGLGGGSSDAAAALRLLAASAGLPAGHGAVVAAAVATGADVSVCLDPSARMMAGIGERVGEKLGLPPLFAVLANPGVAAPTPSVFRELGLRPGQRLREDPGAPPPRGRAALMDWLAARGNDLEAPALRVAPAVGETLAALRATQGCRLARMSGSGATCFGLYDDCHAAARAARTLRTRHPGWWIAPTLLR